LVNWKKISLPKNLGGLGIRAAREANTSLLGNLVWDMVQSINKLWVSLLLNKYTGGQNTLLASASNNSSPTWSSLIRAKNILRKGTLSVLVRVHLPFGSAIGTLSGLLVTMFLLLISMTFIYMLRMFFPL